MSQQKCTGETLRAERCDEVYAVYNSKRYGRATPPFQPNHEGMSREIKVTPVRYLQGSTSSTNWTVHNDVGLAATCLERTTAAHAHDVKVPTGDGRASTNQVLRIG